MIKVYEAKSKKWYESIRLASQVCGCNETTIKQMLDKGERIINGKMRDFRTTDIEHKDVFSHFIRKHKLKLMIANFYLAPDKKVYLWARKKKEWMEWKTYTFENGNISFKTTLCVDGFKCDKWIRVHEYYKTLFPELVLTPVSKTENPFI
jgi:hypothetical protein